MKIIKTFKRNYRSNVSWFHFLYYFNYSILFIYIVLNADNLSDKLENVYISATLDGEQKQKTPFLKKDTQPWSHTMIFDVEKPNGIVSFF